jgi:hypothetical protein
MMPAGQLKILESRNLPAPSEAALQFFLVELIKRTIDKRWRFTHLPMGERRDKATAAKLHRMGTSSGWPDFLFCGPGQVAVWLELKSKNGRLSETQVAMREFLQDSGFEYLCAHDVDQAIAWLKHHGILRGGFTAQ